MSVGAKDTGLSPVAEVIKPPTVSEVGQPPASLADNLEKMTEVNPHQALESLANNLPPAPNLIIDAKGTEKYVSPINEASGIPAVSSLTEATNQPQSQLNLNQNKMLGGLQGFNQREFNNRNQSQQNQNQFLNNKILLKQKNLQASVFHQKKDK